MGRNVANRLRGNPKPGRLGFRDEQFATTRDLSGKFCLEFGHNTD
jgi:hypothetical protein